MTRKIKAITLIKEFINEHAHQFFILSDIRNHYRNQKSLSQLLHFQQYEVGWNKDLSMAFKKMNLRFKPAWISHDLLLKLKFLWIFRFIIKRKHYVLYIDEFNISDASIKSFNWSQRRKQDYWFSNKKLNKHNCIITVSNNGPKNILYASKLNKRRKFCFVCKWDNW